MRTSQSKLPPTPSLAVVRVLAPAMYGQIVLCREVSQDQPAADRFVVVKQVCMRKAQSVLRFQRHSPLETVQLADSPAQEQRIAHRLRKHGQHANVLTHFSESQSGVRSYFVMEYCANGDLHSYMEQRLDPIPFQEAEAISLFYQITSGLAFLHRHGIAHRDLSLENVLLHRGVCKLADFGLAVHVPPSKRQSHIPLTRRVGKAYYMAPEVVLAGTTEVLYDPFAANRWSLGILLFILLTGSPLVPLASLHEDSFRAFVRLCESSDSASGSGIDRVLQGWHLQHLISPHAISILAGLLQLVPSKRSTLDTVLSQLQAYAEIDASVCIL